MPYVVLQDAMNSATIIGSHSPTLDVARLNPGIILSN
jgi:hypothetical protein